MFINLLFNFSNPLGGVIDSIKNHFNGVIDNIKTSIVNILLQLWGEILKLFYGIFSSFGGILDAIQSLYSILCGTGSVVWSSSSGMGQMTNPFTGQVITLSSNNIVVDVFMSDYVLGAFMHMLILSVILLIIFTVMAIVKNEYSTKLERGDKDKDNNKSEIIRMACKSLLGFLCVPLACIFGVIASSYLMQALDGATSVSGKTSISSKIFTISARDANRVRSDDKFFYGLAGDSVTKDSSTSDEEIYNYVSYEYTDSGGQVVSVKVRLLSTEHTDYATEYYIVVGDDRISGTFDEEEMKFIITTTNTETGDDEQKDFNVVKQTQSEAKADETYQARSDDIEAYSLSNAFEGFKGKERSVLASYIDSCFQNGTLVEKVTNNSSEARFSGSNDKFGNFVKNGSGINDSKVTINGESKSYFDYKNASQVFYFYDLTKYHWLIALFSIAYVLSTLVKMTLGAAGRLYELAILFIVSPAIIAMAPLDGNQALGKWQQKFIGKVTMIYAPVIAINLYFILVGQLTQVDIVATLTNTVNSSLSISNNLACSVDLLNLTAVAESAPEVVDSTVALLQGTGAVLAQQLFYLFILISGLKTCENAVGWLGELIGAENILSKGDEIKKDVSEFVRTNAAAKILTFGTGAMASKATSTVTGKLKDHRDNKKKDELDKNAALAMASRENKANEEKGKLDEAENAEIEEAKNERDDEELKTNNSARMAEIKAGGELSSANAELDAQEKELEDTSSASNPYGAGAAATEYEMKYSKGGKKALEAGISATDYGKFNSSVKKYRAMGLTLSQAEEKARKGLGAKGKGITYDSSLTSENMEKIYMKAFDSAKENYEESKKKIKEQREKNQEEYKKKMESIEEERKARLKNIDERYEKIESDIKEKFSAERNKIDDGYEKERNEIIDVVEEGKQAIKDSSLGDRISVSNVSVKIDSGITKKGVEAWKSFKAKGKDKDKK